MFAANPQEGIAARYPLELVAFSDKKGRFGGPFGSQALCGKLNPGNIHTAVDLNGIYLSEVMQQHGLSPMETLPARRPPGSVHAYLEDHIEQGPVLDNLNCSIGLVTGFTGLFT